MKLADFEQRVWEVEGIRIVVRGHENDEVKDYTFKHAAMGNWRTRELLERHLSVTLDYNYFSVTNAGFYTLHGSVLLRTLRKSYSPK
jgi:hypothetical protein